MKDNEPIQEPNWVTIELYTFDPRLGRVVDSSGKVLFAGTDPDCMRFAEQWEKENQEK